MSTISTRSSQRTTLDRSKRANIPIDYVRRCRNLNSSREGKRIPRCFESNHEHYAFQLSHRLEMERRKNSLKRLPTIIFSPTITLIMQYVVIDSINDRLPCTSPFREMKSLLDTSLHLLLSAVGVPTLGFVIAFEFISTSCEMCRYSWKF